MCGLGELRRKISYKRVHLLLQVNNKYILILKDKCTTD